MMWLLCVGSLWALFIGLARRTHPQLALGVVVPLAWLFPVWIQWTLIDSHSDSIVGTGIDVKLGTTIVVLVSYLFFQRATYPFRLAPCDWAMLGMLLVHGLSDFYYQGPQPLVLGRMYAEWWAPYVVGRVAFQFRQDISRFWPVLVLVAMALAVMSMTEMFSGSSVYEMLFGPRPMEGRPGVATRWGLRRAYGPTLNPIYFGSLQLILFCWSLYAAARAIKNQASVGWLIAPVVCGLGIICCGSRAPMLGMVLVLPPLLFLRFPGFRVSIVVLALLVSTIGFMQRERLIEALEHWSGEDRHYRADVRVVVNEHESKEYSTTRYRLLLLDVYKIAFFRAGLLGFGTEAVTGFPIQIPVGPQEGETLHRLRMIDNTYLLITLRFGYLGLFCFASAACLAIYQLFKLNEMFRDENVGLLIACMASSLFAMLPVLFTVWMPPDYGFVLLWSWGASSGMYVAHRQGTFNRLPPGVSRGT